MRPAALAAFGGATAAVLTLLLAGAAGGPYLTAEHVNGWIVAFAAALLLFLIAAPFVLESWLRERTEARERPAVADQEPGAPERKLRDERWEGAALGWGGLTLCVLAVAIPVGLAASFSGDSLAGTAALIATIESGLVLGTLALWLLSG